MSPLSPFRAELCISEILPKAEANQDHQLPHRSSNEPQKENHLINFTSFTFTCFFFVPLHTPKCTHKLTPQHRDSLSHDSSRFRLRLLQPSRRRRLRHRILRWKRRINHEEKSSTRTHTKCGVAYPAGTVSTPKARTYDFLYVIPVGMYYSCSFQSIVQSGSRYPNEPQDAKTLRRPFRSTFAVRLTPRRCKMNAFYLWISPWLSHLLRNS